MDLSNISSALQTDTTAIATAIVRETCADGDVIVRIPDEPGKAIRCRLLRQLGAEVKQPPIGCSVLIWIDIMNERGVVLGVLDGSIVEQSAASTPDELVIEARESLTLRVGDGSITIRADGKILIKGKDLVSHAQNLNRIKGGAVAIN